MEDCIFCKIVNNQVNSVRTYEDENTIAFMEATPSAPGHVMVISKKHGKSIFDYEGKDLGVLMDTVSKVAKKIEKALSSDSITIGINHLEKKGVPHLHIHLIPRWDNDKGGIIQSIVKNVPRQSREEIAERIKKA
ncbi:MAG: hypothetical protein A3B38_00645 [Candidatus Levybacteria bacterium RIFCSPLOWO2_01_FULL_36_13]|nr:MAG: hypothetical protein A2684_01885 [Candidatus Levybacteria bacterium RIFCSPHIGHO2_01_FULL_36_15b]OGH35396.1 MAG: hypothetical protein A3B38_00645 [Candidatus Levybacteria bacterium RIFCSPLOWO2_01_FULL_36_13]